MLFGTWSQVHACDPYDLYGDQALLMCVICIQADLLCYFLLSEKAVCFKSVQ